MNYTKYLLIFSIILNLVFIGFITGGKFNTFFLKNNELDNNKIVNFISETELSDIQKKNFINRVMSLQFSRNQNGGYRKSFQKQISKIIEAEEFDEEALRLLFETRAEFFIDNHQKAINTIIDLLETLSKEDRKKISKVFHLKNF